MRKATSCVPLPLESKRGDTLGWGPIEFVQAPACLLLRKLQGEDPKYFAEMREFKRATKVEYSYDDRVAVSRWACFLSAAGRGPFSTSELHGPNCNWNNPKKLSGLSFWLSGYQISGLKQDVGMIHACGRLRFAAEVARAFSWESA